MDEELAANPETGGAAPDIHTAAQAIEGILTEPEEEDGPTEDASDDRATPDEEELEAEPESEEEADEGETEDSDKESEEDEGEPTDTLEALAKVVGTEPEVLTGQLKVPVKIDGETSLVTLQEALSGYQRDSDYQRKMTNLGEQRRELEAAEQRAIERLQPKFEQLNAALESLEVDTFTDDEFQRILAEEGAEAALLAKSQADAKKAKVLDARKLLEQERQAAADKQKQDMEAFLAREKLRVVERIPAMADSVKAPKIQSDIRSYLKSVDFTEEEIAQLADSRMAKVAYDAMRLAAIEKAKPQREKQLKKLPKVLKGGKGESKKPNKGAADRRRLQKTGHVRDAARVIENLI